MAVIQVAGSDTFSFTETSQSFTSKTMTRRDSFRLTEREGVLDPETVLDWTQPHNRPGDGTTRDHRP